LATLKRSKRYLIFFSKDMAVLAARQVTRDCAANGEPGAPGKPHREAINVEGAGVALIEVTASRVQPMPDVPQLEKLRSERELQKYARRNADAYVAEILEQSRIRKNPLAFE
jgi:hypothetical protein